MLTIEQIEQRVQVLTQEREQLVQNIMAAQANLNAYNGAIGEFERLVAELKRNEQQQVQVQE